MNWRTRWFAPTCLNLWKRTIKLFERYAIEEISLRPNEGKFCDGIVLRYSRDTRKGLHYSHDVKTSLWHMSSAVEEVDYNRIRYQLHDSFAFSVTDICDDVEVETHLQLIREKIYAPKSSTNWWCKTRKPVNPVRYSSLILTEFTVSATA